MDGGDEEPEEDDELDEAEALNEAIARSEEERALFTQMDKDRKEAEEYAWAAAGNKGKLFVTLIPLTRLDLTDYHFRRPERLIQEHELPQVYQMEHASQVIQDEIFDDGARRARTQVTYDDGLSEEQWLVVSESHNIRHSILPDALALYRDWKRQRKTSPLWKRSEPLEIGRPRRSRRWTTTAILTIVVGVEIQTTMIVRISASVVDRVMLLQSLLL